MLSEADFAGAEAEKSKVISVNHFIDEKEINSICFENSYFIEPEKHGEKAYGLLSDAPIKSGKVGVAQFILGVDDWVFRKSIHYSTILVDMETSKPHRITPIKRK